MNLDVIPLHEEQISFFGMPIEARSFMVTNSKGRFEGELTYHSNVAFKGRGTVIGVSDKNGTRTWIIEATETELLA